MNRQQREELEALAPDYSFYYHDLDTFASRSDAQSLMEQAEVIIGNLSPEKISKLRNLKWMQLFSAGANGYTDNGGFPTQAVLTNATGAYGLAISEHMLGMLLMLQKKLHLYRDNQPQGLWKSEGNITAVEESRTLVIGLGDIGGDFAKKMKALGSYTVGVKRHASAKPDYLDELHLSDALDKLLPEADIVALSLPETDETKQMLDRKRIGLLKNSAYVLNVGRGSAIDTEALSDALDQNKLAGAGLDVTDPEPLPADHRLWKMKNALITPHVSGGFHLKSTQNRIASITIENMKRYIKGESLINQVDFNTGYRKFDQNL